MKTKIEMYELCEQNYHWTEYFGTHCMSNEVCNAILTK